MIFLQSIKKLKIEKIIIILFPFLIISGPAIPDIFAIILILFFLYKIYKYKNFKIKNEYWVFIFFAIYIWFLFISFFAYNFYLSISDSIIFLRFFLFIFAIYYFCKLNNNLFNYILLSIFLSVFFVMFDTLFQFYNYDHKIGFKGDIFNIYPEGNYGRLSGPFRDLVPGAYLSRFYFFLISFLIINKEILNNKILSKLFILFLSLCLSVIFFSGEQMSVSTSLLGFFLLFIFLKKLRKIIFYILIISITFITANQVFHPYYKNFVVVKNSATHEGVTIERSFKCETNTSKICTKKFKKQPNIITTLQDFSNSPYGEIYNTAYQIWLDNKFTGIGLNNFEEVCLNENKYSNSHKNFGCTSHPHNYYIQALVESGLPGLFLLSILIFSFFYKFRKFKTNHYNLFGIIILLVLFWPIMSTGSFIKNWNMIFLCYVVGINLSFYSNKKNKAIIP